MAAAGWTVFEFAPELDLNQGHARPPAELDLIVSARTDILMREAPKLYHDSKGNGKLRLQAPYNDPAIFMLLLSYIREGDTFALPEEYAVALKLLSFARNFQVNGLFAKLKARYPLLDHPMVQPGMKLLSSTKEYVKAIWEERTIIWRIDATGLIDEYHYRDHTHRTYKKRKGPNNEPLPDLVTSWHVYGTPSTVRPQLVPTGDENKLEVRRPGQKEAMGTLSRGHYGVVFECTEGIYYVLDAPPGTVLHQVRVETEKVKEEGEKKERKAGAKRGRAEGAGEGADE